MIDAFAAFAEPGLRLAAAAIAGMVIGLNRDIAGKAMGARTLGLVSVGAAIVALAAIGDPLIGPHPDARSRVIQGVLQGVLTGVGFLGAGVIVRRADNNDVKNLTTAATVWVTAAVGIACGLGEWALVAWAITLTLAILVLGQHVEDWFVKRLGKPHVQDTLHKERNNSETD